MPLNYQGRVYIRPQVIAKIDDSALAAQNLPGSANLALAGTSEGGTPKEAVWFTSVSQARATLRSGNLLKAVERAFSPSPSVLGAGRIACVRVDPAVQGSLVLKDSAAADVITLTSVDYGLYVNRIKVKVEAGSTKGKKITVALDADSLAQDDITRDGLSVQYTGAGTAATMSITATQLATTITGATGDAVTLLFTQYPTLRSLVDALNAKGVYTASVKGPDPDAAATTLDFVTAQDIKAAAYTALCNLQAVIDWFNSGQQGWVTAAKASGAGTVPANIGFTYLSGGADGTVANADWQAAFDVLKNEDVGVVVPVIDTAGIHAMAKAHVDYMSTTGAKERVAVVGGAAAEAIAAVKTRAFDLNSDRVMLAYPGLTDYDSEGNLVDWAPYFVAAQYAGMLCGQDYAEPLTRKYISATKLEKKLTPEELDDLLLNGVAPIELVPGKGFRVAQSITTWRIDTKLTRREMSCRRTADEVVRRARVALDAYVGSPTSPILLSKVKVATISALRSCETDGLIVGTTENPAFKNIQVTISGELVVVSFEASISVPANYITLTAHIQPYKS